MSAAAPEISVVIPCLNEEEAVGKVVDQAFEGIRRSGRPGEVVVVDNASTDRPPRSLPRTARASCSGAAAATAAPTSPGSRRRAATTSSWAMRTTRIRCASSPRSSSASAAGDDLVIGSRFKGTIHGDAMPFLNRFVGNPILTGMLNVLFGVKVSDAHCGMRAVRRDALPVLDLHSTGMEFASEMVFKAYRRGLPVSEVPIDYYPRVGESKLNRFGDAWRHVASCSSTARAGCTSFRAASCSSSASSGVIVLAAGPVDALRPHVADPHDARLASR